MLQLLAVDFSFQSLQERKNFFLKLKNNDDFLIKKYPYAIDFLCDGEVLHEEFLHSDLQIKSNDKSVHEGAGAHLVTGPGYYGMNYSSNDLIKIYFHETAREFLTDWQIVFEQAARASFFDEKEVEQQSFKYNLSFENHVEQAFGNFLSEEERQELSTCSKGFFSLQDFLNSSSQSVDFGVYYGLSWGHGVFAQTEHRLGLMGPRVSRRSIGFYEKLGMKPGQVGSVSFLANHFLQNQTPLYFFVPKSVLDPQQMFVTRSEMLFMLQNKNRIQNVSFIFGSYAWISRRQYYQIYKRLVLQQANQDHFDVEIQKLMDLNLRSFAFIE